MCVVHHRHCLQCGCSYSLGFSDTPMKDAWIRLLACVPWAYGIRHFDLRSFLVDQYHPRKLASCSIPPPTWLEGMRTMHVGFTAPVTTVKRPPRGILEAK